MQENESCEKLQTSRLITAHQIKKSKSYRRATLLLQGSLTDPLVYSLFPMNLKPIKREPVV